MFMDEEVRPAKKSVTASPSLASDLSWLLFVAARPDMQVRYPKLVEMYKGREDLAARVRNFWDDWSEATCFAEMQVLAHHGGALGETDPEALWRAIEAGVATVPLDLDMPSESAEERAVYTERFRLLRSSPDLLQSYLELLQEVWGPINDMWQQALPVIEEAGRLVVAQYERGQSLETLITAGCDILEERMPEVVTSIEAGKPLLFVPCLFFGTNMYLEFSNLIVIGTGVGQGDVVARARTESVARRLKAVADPTRLALLHSLATAPSTVGELALLFRLAQPTVSMHVKVLRESGLVRSERQGGRMRLSADAGAVEELLGELSRVVLQGAGAAADQPVGANTTGSDRIPATVVDSTRTAGPVTA
jgi:DNA-binding transcriptional ArsR family regulator